MPLFDIKMPKMGESVEEATITKWFVKTGDVVSEDDVLLEIATDKVDSEIPSPVAGRVVKVLFNENDKVSVGVVIAVIDTSGGEASESTPAEKSQPQPAQPTIATQKMEAPTDSTASITNTEERFYSPLVKSIAKQEGITQQELNTLTGSGSGGRVTKNDVLAYLQQRNVKPADRKTEIERPVAEPASTPPKAEPVSVSISAGDEIIEMDRMRKLIAEHMVRSKQISPHVTNMVEADVTNIVLWRNKVKDTYEQREKLKLTYMPLFIEAAVKALKDFPMVNASVDGTRIILRKAINFGVAVALPTGNLIVPVIKNADMLNLNGIAHELNRLATAARNNKLSPDDIQGGTFTLTNFGTFRNVMGTPIINQPQVAILATGTIEKKPAVVETPAGDVIAIRHKMFLSLTYDHRIVDGVLGGSYLRRITDYLEAFDVNTTI